MILKIALVLEGYENHCQAHTRHNPFGEFYMKAESVHLEICIFNSQSHISSDT